MQNTVRTTIRIRKDLLDQSRLLALYKGVSLQDVINDTLALGYKHVTDLQKHSNAIKEIDAFRKKFAKKNINIENLLQLNKADQK